MLYKPNLITRKLLPENQEFPIIALSGRNTPENLFYIRNHFPYPTVDICTWRLQIEGLVDRPICLNYEELLQMHLVSLPVTLECAGEKRSFFHPKVRGEQWELGASSHAIWTGVRLSDLLHAAGIRRNAVEVTFEGMDKGVRTDMSGVHHYERSLPIQEALNPDVLIALYMNGKPLPYRHGYPARLIVPGWYGMASVKWLHRISVVDVPFKGPFQAVDYVYKRSPTSSTTAEPVTTIQLNATMARPTHQEVLARGDHWFVGTAISGNSSVELVEISTDNGVTWRPATWLDQAETYSWRRWCYPWSVNKPGTYKISVRASDSKGNTQPETPDWNVKGYGYNAIQEIQIYVD